MIRHAQTSDLTYLTEIERKANRLFPVGRIPDPEQTIPPQVLNRAMADDLLFVACHEQKVVGYAMCSIGDDALHLNEVAVDPEYCRRGIGRKLVEFVIAESKHRNLVATTLTTFNDLPFNRPFYESVGFRVVDKPDLTARLAMILENEKRLGMVNRVAMKMDNSLI